MEIGSASLGPWGHRRDRGGRRLGVPGGKPGGRNGRRGRVAEPAEADTERRTAPKNEYQLTAGLPGFTWSRQHPSRPGFHVSAENSNPAPVNIP